MDKKYCNFKGHDTQVYPIFFGEIVGDDFYKCDRSGVFIYGEDERETHVKHSDFFVKDEKVHYYDVKNGYIFPGKGRIIAGPKNTVLYYMKLVYI